MALKHFRSLRSRAQVLSSWENKRANSALPHTTSASASYIESRRGRRWAWARCISLSSACWISSMRASSDLALSTAACASAIGKRSIISPAMKLDARRSGSMRPVCCSSDSAAISRLRKKSPVSLFGTIRSAMAVEHDPISCLACLQSRLFPQPALMFAFKGSDAIIRFRSGGRGQLGGAHSRRQDPKTPVEQALMRGLVTA